MKEIRHFNDDAIEVTPVPIEDDVMEVTAVPIEKQPLINYAVGMLAMVVVITIALAITALCVLSIIAINS